MLIIGYLVKPGFRLMVGFLDFFVLVHVFSAVEVGLELLLKRVF